MSTTQVLIAGAGPTGLLLALSLLQNGLKVRIIDKDANRNPGQRGAGLQPRTLEIHHFLGVIDDVLALAFSVRKRCEYKLPGGVEVLKVTEISPELEPTPEVPYPNGMLLGQYNTEAILRKHIERLGGTVEYGTALRSFEQHPDHVDAVLVKKVGDTEDTEHAAAHWLVGSDGAKGVVRKQLELSFLGESPEAEQLILGLVEVQGLKPEYWHQWGEFPSGALLLMPTEKPGYYAFGFTGNGRERPDISKLMADEEALREAFYERIQRKDLVFGKFEAASTWRLNIRMVDKYGEGRVFVAGDAAHVHSPAGGQGLNSGAQDSFNLAWKLALVEKGVASPSLLSTYNEERLPVIAAMLQKSTLLHKSMASSQTSEAGWKRGGDLRQLGVNYRWSSIVLDERTPKPDGHANVNPYGDGTDGTLRAGDRAPQAPGLVPVLGGGADETSLFDVFRPDHHTVLLFNTPAEVTESVLAVAKKYAAGLVKTVLILPQGTSSPQDAGQLDLAVVDKDGHAFTAYQVSPEKPTVVIVRPDGVVGGIVYGLDGFKEYFKGVFTAVGDAA